MCIYSLLKIYNLKLNVYKLSAKDIHFATECDIIQNYLNFENDEDILLNHVNSK